MTSINHSLNHLVDVHSHIYPMPYLELLETRQDIPRVDKLGGRRKFVIFPEEESPRGGGGREMGAEFWDLEEKIRFMDSLGIDRSIVSLGNPWLDPFPDARGDEAAAQVNLIMSGYEEVSGGRVTAVGVLPASSIEAVIKTLGEIAENSGLYGIVTGPRIAGRRFDDLELDPVWRELERLSLPLFVHPQNGTELTELTGYDHTLPVGLGFPFETTIAVTRLVFGGVLARYPELRILVAHGGGCLPYLGGRLDAVWRSDPEIAGSLPEPPSAYLQRLYLDALVYYGPAFQSAYRLVGAKHLLFGTDHPFSVANPELNLQTIQHELDNSGDLQFVTGISAETLFNLT